MTAPPNPRSVADTTTQARVRETLRATTPQAHLRRDVAVTAAWLRRLRGAGKSGAAGVPLPPGR